MEGPAVAVFGSNDAREGTPAYETARAVGAGLAELGYVVANGGYGGTMAASARGAKAAGGRTIGVVCSVFSSEANRYTDRVIETHSPLGRLAALIEIGRGGYVVLPGATGTLAELATVWEMLSKGLLPRRPLVCIGPFWTPLIEMLARTRPGAGQFISTAAAADELPRHFPPRKPA